MKVKCIKAGNCHLIWGKCLHQDAHDVRMITSTLEPCTAEWNCPEQGIPVYCYELEPANLSAEKELILQPAQRR